MTRLVIPLLVLLLTLTACRTSDVVDLDDLPTPIDLTDLPTHAVLTENAPPEGYSSVNVPAINDGLASLGSWQSSTQIFFDGVVSGTPREINSSLIISEWYDLVGSSKRVVVASEGDLFTDNTTLGYEAVQMGPDYFVVEGEGCFQPTENDGERAMQLTSAQLLGGIGTANAKGQQAIINSEQAWLYDFRDEQFQLPIMNLGESGTIISLHHDLWYAPEHNTVIRYYATVEVENIFILDSTLPYTGTITIQYDVSEIDEFPNITVPNGC